MKAGRKKILTGFIVLVAVAVALLIVQLARMMPVATGFAAKNMCSAVFISQREPAEVDNIDIGFFPVSLSAEKVDRTQKTVEASIWGLFEQTAIYRPTYGCTLLQNDALPESPALLPDKSTAMKHVLADSVFTGLNTSRISAAIENAFAENDTNGKKNTRAVLVVFRGKLIAERYSTGIDSNTRLVGWSMTKTITNAMVGILVAENKLSLSQTALLPEWDKDERKKISLNDLMQMTSGLEWVEKYDRLCAATQMLYKENDMGAYAASSPAEDVPGTKWKYSSGTTNIIQRIIKSKFNAEELYLKFPYEKLFYPCGMMSTQLETDGSNTYVGSSYAYATARDWARFGLLYLNDGVMHGNRILPEGWVKYTTTPVAASDCGVYGAQVWLNKPDCKSKSVNSFPDCPADMYLMDGFKGQYVVIVPSKNLVVVRLGYSNHFDLNKLMSEIISSLPD